MVSALVSWNYPCPSASSQLAPPLPYASLFLRSSQSHLAYHCSDNDRERYRSQTFRNCRLVFLAFRHSDTSVRQRLRSGSRDSTSRELAALLLDLSKCRPLQLVGCEATAAESLTSSELVRHLTFIGSEPVGRKVAASAGAAGTQVVLELGGKVQSFIVYTKIASLIFSYRIQQSSYLQQT